MKELIIAGAGRGDPGCLQALQREELRGVQGVLCYQLPAHVREALHEKGHQLLEVREAGTGDPAEEERAAVDFILTTVEEKGRFILLLPGRPWIGDSLFAGLHRQAKQGEVSLRVFHGEDVWGPVMEQLAFEFESREGSVFLSRGAAQYDVYRLDELREPLRSDLFIANAASPALLRYAKERLVRFYPEDHQVNLLQFDREGRPFLAETIGLENLQMLSSLHRWSFLHLPPTPRYTLGDLVHLMERLRSPGGCPWDREQDHMSLKPYLLEEAYEVLGAIDHGDDTELCEELGDLLLQVAFHSQVAAERGRFSLLDAITEITSKIYRRHPHVFQQEKAEDASEVSLKWQEIKRNEKKKKDRFAMSQALPSLMKAQKVQKRAAEVGFDWPDVGGALAKIREEVEELQGEIEGKKKEGEQKKEKLKEEVGDLFFALVNVARFLDIDAELALHQALEKFKTRFSYIEEQVNQRGGDYSCFSLEELDGWWDEAKLREKDIEEDH